MGVGETIKNAFRHPEDKTNTAQDGGVTGREGVPGTVTEGDPSMGGKHNDAEPSARSVTNQSTPGVVQNGDPSMGGKHTSAEGINQ
ncbi:protein of unknown function [Taphrina deformans PYCC 5710]|uniref:Uncharacterized protein n=1 Tax=Taphrina deformans (strain PYCC 5710 / ATCC 11124 / CBS 356.35 / IMI 108563 / JCM 9778 / NBRC 8474) TaxID=1097556 RepID=R4XBZ8_TAPDE|nr:protein of unknown function [Taphrina deformans PYCC 5710]|eukprot:CCG83085.1 protein of unknown function [Taphrina deformans PYCC 5710]